MRAILRRRDFGEKLGIALLFLIPIIIISVVAILIHNGSIDDGLNYKLAEDGSGYIVTKYDGNEDLVTIPNKHQGKPVVAIGEGAFQGNTTLMSVRIPGSVKTIESNAFAGCDKLLDVTLNSGTEVIEKYAFKNCPYIAYLNLCDTLKVIEPGAFYGCSRVAYITIPEGNTTYHTNGSAIFHTEDKTLVVGGRIFDIPTDGSVTKIGEMAFAGNIKHSIVSVPEGITEIGNDAFADCTNLAIVELPESLQVIGDGAFSNCLFLGNIRYAGSDEAWNKIEIGEHNLIFESAIRYFNYGKNEEVTE